MVCETVSMHFTFVHVRYLYVRKSMVSPISVVIYMKMRMCTYHICDPNLSVFESCATYFTSMSVYRF